MPDTVTLDSSTIILAMPTLTLGAVTVQAWRLKNERRDVALLGACSGWLAARTVITVVF